MHVVFVVAQIDGELVNKHLLNNSVFCKFATWTERLNCCTSASCTNLPVVADASQTVSFNERPKADLPSTFWKEKRPGIPHFP